MNTVVGSVLLSTTTTVGTRSLTTTRLGSANVSAVSPRQHPTQTQRPIEKKIKTRPKKSLDNKPNGDKDKSPNTFEGKW
jgi:hypothetical protein